MKSATGREALEYEHSFLGRAKVIMGSPWSCLSRARAYLGNRRLDADLGDGLPVVPDGDPHVNVWIVL